MSGGDLGSCVTAVLHPPTGTDGVALVFRAPRLDDGGALWTLARNNGLDENSPYAYLMWAEYFADTTVVAADTDTDEPVAFVTGFRSPADPATVFVWQIGVAATHRRQGIAGRLLDHLAAATGAAWIEATVTPTNLASETLFRRFGERHDATTTVTDLFEVAHFPPGHEAERRFRIGPITDTFPEGEMHP